MRKKSSCSSVILNLIQNLYRFRVRPRMTRKPKPSSYSFFPHISLRIPSEKIKNIKKRVSTILNNSSRLARRLILIIFLLMMIFFLFLNLHAELYPDDEKLAQAKRAVLALPFEAKTHLNLAGVYLEMGNLEAAEKELSLAKSLSSTISSQIMIVDNGLKIAKEKPDKIRREIVFWEKVAKEKPDYRDAYFQLAVLNYQIAQKEKTKEYLQKVLELDPNFEPAQKLEKLFSN